MHRIIVKPTRSHACEDAIRELWALTQSDTVTLTVEQARDLREYIERLEEDRSDYAGQVAELEGECEEGLELRIEVGELEDEIRELRGMSEAQPQYVLRQYMLRNGKTGAVRIPTGKGQGDD